MKKLVAMLLCLAMVLGMTACGAKTEAPVEAPTLPSTYEELDQVQEGVEDVDFEDTTIQYKEHINIGVDAALTTLDPHATPGTPTADYTMMVYDRLINFNENTMEFEPELATEWTWVDNVTLELKLRQDVKFSDGSPFTAADVVFSFERMLGDTSISAKLTSMESVEAVDDYTVRFNLNAPNMDFLFSISYYCMCIVSKAACEADPENGYKVTTGAWIVEDFEPSNFYALTVNENYWGNVPVTKKITVRYIAEASARLIALQNGELDICLRVSEEEAVYAQEDPNVALTIFPTNTCIYFAFDTSEGPGADYNFRMALAHCLKKDDIILAAANGYGQIAVSNWGFRTYGYDDSFGDYPYDLELAKQYLEKTEYREINVIVRGSKTRDVNALTVVQEQARQIGITINIEGVENANLSEQTKYDNHAHEAVVFSYGWSTFGDDSRMPYTVSNANKAHVDDATITELIDKAVQEPDEAKRKEMYAQVQLINHENGYYLPLFYSVIFQAMHKDLQGAIWGSAVNDMTYVCVPIQ